MSDLSRTTGTWAHLRSHFCTRFPELVGHDNVYVPIIQDLYARGLIDMSPDSLSTMMNAHSAQRAATTNLGKRFLGFVAAPSHS